MLCFFLTQFPKRAMFDFGVAEKNREIVSASQGSVL